MKVSILILLEVILEDSWDLQQHRRLRVSILILLEVILEVACHACQVFVLNRFQSLFYWK